MTKKGEMGHYKVRTVRKCSGCGLNLWTKIYYVGDSTICKFCKVENKGKL